PPEPPVPASVSASVSPPSSSGPASDSSEPPEHPAPPDPPEPPGPQGLRGASSSLGPTWSVHAATIRPRALVRAIRKLVFIVMGLPSARTRAVYSACTHGPAQASFEKKKTPRT